MFVSKLFGVLPKKLRSLGIKTLRYRDEDVNKKLEAVSEHMYAEIEERAKRFENPPSA